MSNKREYPVKRDLDGVYYRVERNGKWVNRCYSDLTNDEQDALMAKYNVDQLRRLCHILSDALREIGEELDLYRDIIK